MKDEIFPADSNTRKTVAVCGEGSGTYGSRRDLLIGSGVVTQLVVGATEFAGRSWALEPAHRTVAAFDAAMILLQPVVEILAVAMPKTCAQGRPDRARITVVPIRGDPVDRDH